MFFSARRVRKDRKEFIKQHLRQRGSLAPRDKSAQRLAETCGYLLYSFAILPLRSPVAVKLATTPAPA